jgi:hypothetical protein
MGLSEGIRKHGFRKWYERELLGGHAHLGLVIICTLGLMMALEASSRFSSLADQLIDIAAVVLCTGAGLWANTVKREPAVWPDRSINTSIWSCRISAANAASSKPETSRQVHAARMASLTQSETCPLE